MKNQRGPRKKGYIRVYSSVPQRIYGTIEKEAGRRGLDMSDIIREVLMEKFDQEKESGKSEVGA